MTFQNHPSGWSGRDYINWWFSKYSWDPPGVSEESSGLA